MAIEVEEVIDEPGIITREHPSTGGADLKKAIEKVLKDSKSKSSLKEAGMEDGKPAASYKITYDAATNQLEPVYFWLLDFMQPFVSEPIQKVTDNFTSTPGSGHFAEMGQRATRMQEEGMKIMGMINQVIKTVLNLVYDLKEFEIRLEHYEDANSKDEKTKEAGMLALKQIWLDNVDMKRGRGSIHQMSYEMGFTTLREVFMIANTIEDVKNNKIVNDQVKRILIPRMSEFLKWADYSEKELRKRFSIERSYLKTEVESLKLYTSWVRPYLKAAEQLRQRGFDMNPALVNAFNTTMFELVLFGRGKIDFAKAVAAKKLPDGFSRYKMKREYYSCYVISFIFRGLPQKVTQQHYGFGGRVDIGFDGYALNEEELKLIERELKKQDLEDGLKFVQQATDQSLEELKEDLDHFLDDDKEKKKKDGEEKSAENANPFSALFSIFKFKKSKKEKKDISDSKKIKKDNFIEKEVRKLALDDVKSGLYDIYDVYKKAHGMASAPHEGFDL